MAKISMSTWSEPTQHRALTRKTTAPLPSRSARGSLPGLAHQAGSMPRRGNASQPGAALRGSRCAHHRVLKERRMPPGPPPSRAASHHQPKTSHGPTEPRALQVSSPMATPSPMPCQVPGPPRPARFSRHVGVPASAGPSSQQHSPSFQTSRHPTSVRQPPTSLATPPCREAASRRPSHAAEPDEVRQPLPPALVLTDREAVGTHASGSGTRVRPGQPSGA